MAGKRIRVDGRRFEVPDWSESILQTQVIHKCGQAVVARCRFTLPKQVKETKLIQIEGDQRCGIVDDVMWGGLDPVDGTDRFRVTGSLFSEQP